MIVLRTGCAITCVRTLVRVKPGRTPPKDRQVAMKQNSMLLIASLMMLLVAGMTNSASAAKKDHKTSGTMHWYKGNTHTHTTMSDGDSTPGVVARWYRDNNYDFLFLTDHNVLVDIAQLQHEIADENAASHHKPFVLVPGEEVSVNYQDTGIARKRALHTCGLDIKTTVPMPVGGNVVQLLQKSIDGIIAAGGMPSVNHPNFLWSLTADDLFALKHLNHFEIYNGHPQTNNLGGGGVPGTEAIWDILLTRGRLYYGMAVDDAHNFKVFRRELSNPGRGWVMVRAPELTPHAIVHALETGNYYPSTGVLIDDIVTSHGKGLAFHIKKKKLNKFKTEFFGTGGKLLKTDESMQPHYEFQSGDIYVRARITSSAGEYAWTQPVFVPGHEAKSW